MKEIWCRYFNEQNNGTSPEVAAILTLTEQVKRIADALEATSKQQVKKETAVTWDFGEIDLHDLALIVENHLREDKKKTRQ